MPNPAPTLFFLHIPKTAGTTLAALLEQHYPEPDVIPRRFFDKNALYVTPDDVERRLDEARSFALIRGHYGGPIRERFFTDRTSITVLREPRARVVSLYNDWRTKSDENLADAPPAERELAALARDLDLGRFLSSGHPLVDRLFRDAQARQLCGFLWDSARPSEGDAKRALDAFDLVGTAELLDPFAIALCRRLGWAPPPAAPRLNTSRGEARLSRLDARTLSVIDTLTPLDRAAHAHAQALCARTLAELLAEPPAAAPFEPTDHADLDMLAPIDGSGWHVREGLDSPHPWRWTGPERESTLLLPLAPGRDYRVRVWVISVIAPDILEGAHLTAGGRSLDIERRDAERGHTILSARLPASLVSRGAPTRLGILVPRTISHADVQPETQDPRPKGLAVTRVTADPA